MTNKSWLFLLIIGFCLMGFASNVSGQSPETMPPSSPFKIRVVVDLSTVEVIALDKSGKPVRNLKREDFQLYEEGKEQEILSIDEVNAESGISSLGANLLDESALHRGKTVFIIFDDTSIKPQYIQAARDSAVKFVKEHMRPQDVFAVANYGMSMQILQNFTNNRDEVLKAIKSFAASNNGSGAIYFENLLRAFKEIIPALARIRGQKSILIYSQSALSQPVPSSQIQNPQDVSALSREKLLDIIHSLKTVPGSNTLATTYRSILDAARKSNVVFYTADPGALNSQDSSIGLSLRSLASESGGFSILDTNAADAELDKLDQQISNYYILGYQSNNPKHDGIYRKLAVRTGVKDVRLKHRESILDRNPVDILSSDKQEKILMAALANPDLIAQLPIIFRPIYFYNSAQEARVIVASRIRLQKIAFKKKGDQLGTALSIMGVAYTENGSQAARFSQTLPIRFDKQKEPEYRKESFLYQNQFKLIPGKYRIKLAVADESGNLGSVEQLLEVPAFPDHGIAASSLVIAEQSLRLPDLIQNLEAQLLDEQNPLLYSSAQIEPSVANRLSVESPIPIMFRLYRLPGSSNDWNLIVKASLLDENGKAYAMNPISLKREVVLTGKTEVAAGCQLLFPKVPPGKYRLIIETIESISGESATLQTDIELGNISSRS
jgi:VWFA-related protein